MRQLLFFVSTHGALTMVYFCIKVWLNKDIIVGCPHGSDDVWFFTNAVEYIFVKVYFDMSSKSIKEYSN
jgi:hypothetical protein